MSVIYYMWNFKPNERFPIPKICIEKNQIFFKEYKIITPDDLEKILKDEKAFDVFPELEKIIPLIPKWIIYADLGRLLVIYLLGGFYSDIDCIILKSILQDNNNKDQLYLFTEKILSDTKILGPREKKEDIYKHRIANYFFGTKKKRCSIIKEMIRECIRRLNVIITEEKTNLSNHDVLWTCGPDVITTIYHNSPEKENIKLMDESYLRHLCTSSWR